LIAFGLPRGAGALLGGVLAAWVVSQLIGDPGPQAAEVRSARDARDTAGEALMARRARSSPAVVTACTHRLEQYARQDPHQSGTDSRGTRRRRLRPFATREQLRKTMLGWLEARGARIHSQRRSVSLDGMLHMMRLNPIGVGIAGVAATAVLLRAFTQMRDRAQLRPLRCDVRDASGEA
jgi:hypothetical protein